MTSVRILLAPSFDLASKTPAHVTVEAEYGSKVWEGSLYTAAHHQAEGPYAGNHVVEGGRPCPCVDTNIPALKEGVIGISHFDLDTMGGILQSIAPAIVRDAGDQTFWQLAAAIDVKGPHRLREALDETRALSRDVERLQAWWAWSSANRVHWSREVVTDVTTWIKSTASPALFEVLACEPNAMRAGREWVKKQVSLNETSFDFVHDDVVIARRSAAFANHLYNTPDGEVLPAVVTHNTETGAVTVSLEKYVSGVSCRDIVQKLWGEEAGGHRGIAGSPRGRVMTDDEYVEAVVAVAEAIIASRSAA